MAKKVPILAAFRYVALGAALALGVATLASTGRSSVIPVAYQSPIATVAGISNAPTLPFGSCVPVRISVGSDAGTPAGVVKFFVDGGLVDTQSLPRSGILTEMVGCCGARITSPLSVGAHHFAADFVPTGNWAPSRAAGSVVITATKSGAGAPGGCGERVTSGLPTAVDAGLPTLAAGSTHRQHTTSAPWISGAALGLAVCAVAGYRRRTRVGADTSRSAHTTLRLQRRP